MVGTCALALLRLLVLVGSTLLAAAAAQAAEPFRIDISIRLDNISAFSPKEKTYVIDGTIWLSYDAVLARALEEGGLDPIDLVVLQNLVNPWDSITEPLTRRTADGRTVRGYRLVGTFYSNEIDYQYFPFGEITLSIVVEPKVGAADTLGNGVQVVAGSGELGSRVGLSGYVLNRWAFVNEPYRRVTTIAGGAAAVESRVVFHLHYGANAYAATVKWILPLAVVMLIMLLTPSLTSTLISERFAVPPMILLTIALMQQSYREGLPAVPYLTFLDKLYAYSLIVTLVFFVVFIWSANALRAASPGEGDRQARHLNRLNLAAQGLAVIGYGVIVAMNLKSTG